MKYLYKIIPDFDTCCRLAGDNQTIWSRSTYDVEGHQVDSFKYQVMPEEGWKDLSQGQINLRGICFVDGKLAALPFPKFFNYGQNPQWTAGYELKNAVASYEKVDGSLLSAYLIGDQLHLKTMKSPYSGASLYAEEALKNRPDVRNYCRSLLDMGLSPMFEYVDPRVQIVIHYDQPDFYYLGSRSLTTGEIYLSYDERAPLAPATIKRPQRFLSNAEATEYLERTGVEGLVAVFEDGALLKFKTEDYLAKHHVLSETTPLSVLRAIRDGYFDDVIGVAEQAKAERAIKVARETQTELVTIIKGLEKEAERLGALHKDLPDKDVFATLGKDDAWLLFQYRRRFVRGLSCYDAMQKRALDIMFERYKGPSGH